MPSSLTSRLKAIVKAEPLVGQKLIPNVELTVLCHDLGEARGRRCGLIPNDLLLSKLEVCVSGPWAGLD